MADFIQFNHRAELSMSGWLVHVVHTQTQQQAAFIGRRWERYGKGRTFLTYPADYKQSIDHLVRVRFLFKEVRKRTLWAEPYQVGLLEEWITLKLQPARKTSWTMKYVQDSDLPF
jgi:hypothetical protein